MTPTPPIPPREPETVGDKLARLRPIYELAIMHEDNKESLFAEAFSIVIARTEELYQLRAEYLDILIARNEALRQKDERIDQQAADIKVLREAFYWVATQEQDEVMKKFMFETLAATNPNRVIGE